MVCIYDVKVTLQAIKSLKIKKKALEFYLKFYKHGNIPSTATLNSVLVYTCAMYIQLLHLSILAFIIYNHVL